PAEATKSYLNIPALISAAEVTDCDAVHPGYGFLAENAGFAEVCKSCRITFIGPSVENIRLMGHKSKAREAAIKAGLPVVSGSEGAINSDKAARKTAKKIGYPIILKATAGGGGRGMRIVHEENELANSLKMAQAESAAAFGNREVYMEKYIHSPRHIEVQILGDNHGNQIQLFERDCSIQRRHQKLIEESPSPSINEKLRRKMGEAALKLVKKIGYTSAGTVEFLLDEDHKFYFMEMNTRIQVEHPVTEMITGIDIIKEQILIASGQKLSITQSAVKHIGHSIECRVNAEDPETFAPSSGTLAEVFLPGGPGVRVDSAIYAGCVISPHYDSLIAKIIVHASDRHEAIARMKRALGELHIDGVKTTVPLLSRILHSEEFRDGNITTRFLEEFGFNA
ncbi:MAG: acetyl-CoA carboxylase biotin carboxylase subunit, partial [Nitrospinota bacterium]